MKKKLFPILLLSGLVLACRAPAKDTEPGLPDAEVPSEASPVALPERSTAAAGLSAARYSHGFPCTHDEVIPLSPRRACDRRQVPCG